MSAIVAGTEHPSGAAPVASFLGRMFVGPWIDYLFIGAGITVPVLAATSFFPARRALNERVPYSCFIAISGAHFAASTVRHPHLGRAFADGNRNGLWWIGSAYLNAWFWTSVFHSIQYLIVAIARHVDEQVPDWRAGGRALAVALHGMTLCVASLGTGAGLFLVMPWLFGLVGFSVLEAYAMVTIVINLHHLLVDGYIWRAPRQRLGSGATVLARNYP